MKCARHVAGCLIFMGILFPLLSVAQVNGTDEMTTHAPDEPQFKYAANAAVQLEYPLNDNALKKSLVGIYGMHGGFQAAVNKRLWAGIELGNEEFAVSVNPKYVDIKTCMFLYRAGVKISYHTTMANDFMFNASLSGGETYIMFNNVAPLAPPPPKGGYIAQSQYYALNILEGYKVGTQYWIGFDLTYTYLPYSFDPYFVGLDHYGITFYPSDLGKPTSYIAWGFEMCYAFGKKK